MDAKLSVTTKCNAQCLTCPVWKHEGQDMHYDDFVTVWDKLMASDAVGRVLVNNTGDMYNHEDCDRIFDYIEKHRGKWVAMTTNAGLMVRVPKIDELVISFNGGTKEAYEYTTGLDFDETCHRIRMAYPQFEKLRKVELHCLIWEGNADSEKYLLYMWQDFPGRVRVSYKYDNQMQEDRTIPEHRRTERIECDYLDKLCIWPNGQVISCAHDFEGVTNWGNLIPDTVDAVLAHPRRMAKKVEHSCRRYEGLCEKCNYNRSAHGMVRYLG